MAENKGVKYDKDKERFDLIPPRPLFMLAKLYTKGAKKYDANNWKKGIKFSRLFAAAQRHLWKFWYGEDIDEETGVPHVINAAWSCIALAEFLLDRPELDDRPELKQTFQEFHDLLQNLSNL